jgi:GPH family glycoside/pentoside/hexuronide:cation symporter
VTIIDGTVPEHAGHGPPRPSLTTKILYGVGEASVSIRMVLFGLFVLFYYSTVLGLSGTLVGVASAAGLIWNAIVDPTIGFASDRGSWGLGRRHTLMLVGSLGAGLFGWALFSPPPGLGVPFLFGWLLVTSLLLRLASSLFGIPFLALGAELSRDYHDRTSVAGVRGAFGLIGLVSAASLPFLVFFPNRTPGVDPKLNRAGYPVMGLALGLAMVVVALVATLSTLRWRQATPRAAKGRALHPLAFVRGFVTALGSRSFRALLVSTSLVFLGTVVNSALAIHFLTYYVQISDSRAISGVQGVFYGAAIVGVLIWLRLTRLVEKRDLYLWATLATALLLVVARLLVGPGRLFGVGDVRPLLVGEALAGFIASVFWIVPTSMVADVVDEDELATGERREGIYYGIFSFGQQTAGGVAAIVTGVLLDQYTGLVPGQVAQSAQTAERIGQLATIGPALAFVVAALLISRYPLNRWRIAAIQHELGARACAPASKVLAPG